MGRKFLDELLNSENLEFYKISTLKMLIKFLYSAFKNKLLFYLLPLYVTQFLMYETSMHTLEFYIHSLHASKDAENNLVLDAKSAKLRQALIVIVTFNFIMQIFQIILVVVTLFVMNMK